VGGWVGWGWGAQDLADKVRGELAHDAVDLLRLACSQLEV